MTYDGHTVERLTKSFCIFWNGGQATLDGVNIVADDPITISIEDGARMLSAAVVSVTRNVIGAKISINPQEQHTAIINFSYLDPNDGVVIEILHDAKEAKLKLSGTIKGIMAGIQNKGTAMRFERSSARLNIANIMQGVLIPLRIATLIITVGIFVIAAVMTMNSVGIIGKIDIMNIVIMDDRVKVSDLISVYVLFFLYAGMGVIIWMTTRRRYPRALNIP